MNIKEISVEQLKVLKDSGEDFQLIDVREESEKRIADIGGELIPVATIAKARERLRTDTKLIVYCRSGGRSRMACEYIQGQFGLTNVYNVSGGILAWADRIDPTIQKY